MSPPDKIQTDGNEVDNLDYEFWYCQDHLVLAYSCFSDQFYCKQVCQESSISSGKTISCTKGEGRINLFLIIFSLSQQLPMTLPLWQSNFGGWFSYSRPKWCWFWVSWHSWSCWCSWYDNHFWKAPRQTLGSWDVSSENWSFCDPTPITPNQARKGNNYRHTTTGSAFSDIVSRLTSVISKQVRPLIHPREGLLQFNTGYVTNPSIMLSNPSEQRSTLELTIFRNRLRDRFYLFLGSNVQIM